MSDKPKRLGDLLQEAVESRDPKAINDAMGHFWREAEKAVMPVPLHEQRNYRILRASFWPLLVCFILLGAPIHFFIVDLDGFWPPVIIGVLLAVGFMCTLALIDWLLSKFNPSGNRPTASSSH